MESIEELICINYERTQMILPNLKAHYFTNNFLFFAPWLLSLLL
jgi:hypothetical protein